MHGVELEIGKDAGGMQSHSVSAGKHGSYTKISVWGCCLGDC
jgi:hypothetical protein